MWWKNLLDNDKALVIISLTMLACVSIYKIPEASENLLNMIASGFFGMVTGYSLKGATTTKPPEIKPTTFLDVINKTDKGE